MDKSRDSHSLITVNQEKCNNCQACVTACPVKICIDASGDKTRVIDDLCIGCGRCIPACLQGARSYIDDTETFFSALAEGENIVAIVAPAAASVFDDVLRLNGYLRASGVRAVFDVSFGAELTVQSYLRHARKNKPKTIIAQPCPALVGYCEIYRPELLPYLAPAHSPMLHSAAMIKHFFKGKYGDAKIAAISPCAAKSREFAATGLVQFNVTMKRLKERFERDKTDLNQFKREKYDGPDAERAVLFSTPGGLRETAARESPEISGAIRKIEGTEIIYKYFDELPEMIAEGVAPFIVDCLNCEAGCNGGPGTGNYGLPVDKLEHAVAKRAREQIAANKRSLFGGRLKRNLKKYDADIYGRTYTDRSERRGRYKDPDEKEIKTVFASMKKYSASDMYNCSACGYGNCYAMAVAVYNGINRPENCHHYLKSKSEEEETLRGNAMKRASALSEEIEKSRHTLSMLGSGVSHYIETAGELGRTLGNSGSKMEDLIERIREISRAAEEKRQSIEELQTSAQATKHDMQALLYSFTELEKTTKEVAGIADVIEDISTSTNLLAMNAAIEAAHAGESGRGFAVVAGEVRNLAGKTGQNAYTISTNIKNIVKQMELSLKLSSKADTLLAKVITDVDNAGQSFAEIITHHATLNEETSAITGDLKMMNEKSAALKEESRGIIKALDEIQSLISSLDKAREDTE